MALPVYLAMTAAEIRDNSCLSPKIAYMACHFSPYGTGLSNRPKQLPEDAMLILNDRTPIYGHDPEWIHCQLSEILTEFRCSSLLLDFQRPGCRETGELVKVLTEGLPCPVAVSQSYADGLSCPVLLSPAPLDAPLKEYLQEWNSREIWLEAALDSLRLELTKEGCTTLPFPHPDTTNSFHDETLHCHYTAHADKQCARFDLFRTREDLDALLEEAESLGVTHAVGLWQELG